MTEMPGIGDSIAGLTILRRIGEGSAGVVFQARADGKPPVALKILKPELAATSEHIRDFENEATATGSVQHEAVVDVLDHGCDQGFHYIVMEFVDGPPLDRYLDKKGRINWRPAVKIVIQVARALGHAHGMGLVHRDVKPGNILMYRDGRARVTDFGIVKDISSLKGYLLNGKQVGTSWYASPEQCLGKRLSEATDVYSLGATLYHLVCGRPPFLGDSANEIMNRHVKAKVRPPSRLVEEVPKGLSNAIEKMLSKRVADRYPNMAALASDLQLILQGKVAIASSGPKVNHAALKQIRSTRSGWRQSRGA